MRKPTGKKIDSGNYVCYSGGLGRVELDKLSPRQLMQFIKNDDIAVALATNVTENLVKNRL